MPHPEIDPRFVVLGKSPILVDPRDAEALAAARMISAVDLKSFTEWLQLQARAHEPSRAASMLTAAGTWSGDLTQVANLAELAVAFRETARRLGVLRKPEKKAAPDAERIR